jgi:hypothetical protein
MKPSKPVQPAPGRLSRWLRRGPLEMAACLVIAAGVLMLLQPFSMALFRHSFLTVLAGTALFTIVSKFPE